MLETTQNNKIGGITLHSLSISGQDSFIFPLDY